MNRQRWLLEFCQHDPEPSGLDRVGRLIGQYPRQAAVLLGILDRSVGAVGAEPRRARHADLAVTPDKAPFRRGDDGAELYSFMRRNCLRRRRLAVLVEIVVGGDRKSTRL